MQGGHYENSKGYFIEPTIVVVTHPRHKLMVEEIFGPVPTLSIYPETEIKEALELCDTPSPYTDKKHI
ncbi:MAG: aldehyde dehydrogenase family protein [Thermodesulfobacteriota bacterium]